MTKFHTIFSVPSRKWLCKHWKVSGCYHLESRKIKKISVPKVCEEKYEIFRQRRILLSWLCMVPASRIAFTIFCNILVLWWSLQQVCKRKITSQWKSFLLPPCWAPEPNMEMIIAQCHIRSAERSSFPSAISWFLKKQASKTWISLLQVLFHWSGNEQTQKVKNTTSFVASLGADVQLQSTVQLFMPVSDVEKWPSWQLFLVFWGFIWREKSEMPLSKSTFTPAGKKGWHESCLANPQVPSSRDVPAAFHPLLPMKTLSGGNIPAWQNFVSEVSDRTRRTKTSNCLAFGFSVVLDTFVRKNWRREEIQFRI